MEVLFTSSDSPMSYLIRSITHENVSHCGIRVGEFVVHSNLLGVQIEPYSVFKLKNRVRHRIALVTRKQDVYRMLHNHYDAGYDFGALFFLTLRYVFPKLTPKRNLWQDSGMFLCTEFVSQILLHENNNMLTPYQLYLKIKDNVDNGILK